MFEIDPDLIRDALLLGGKRTKREVKIEEALQEYVLRRKQQQLLKLLGTVDYDPEYDYKSSVPSGGGVSSWIPRFGLLPSGDARVRRTSQSRRFAS